MLAAIAVLPSGNRALFNHVDASTIWAIIPSSGCLRATGSGIGHERVTNLAFDKQGLRKKNVQF
jgi:hypothetical protein